MLVTEYADCDGTELAHLIHAGELSRGEVDAAAREAIALVNPALNAVVGPCLPPGEPTVGAAQPEPPDSLGSCAGAPFGVNDLACQMAGVPLGSGSDLCEGFVPSVDTDLMQRWRAAGLSPVCRTTTPEFGLSLTTESRSCGITRNPWDLGRSPGGSSGGSAALVAAGALPWAHANDAAGSIRVPASLCGLVGLKPSRARIPAGPGADDPLFGTTVEFAVTRTVRDAARLYKQVAGSGPDDRVSFPMYTTGVSEFRQPPIRRLRIALSTTSPFGGGVNAANVRTARGAAKILEELGHEVVEAEVRFDAGRFIDMLVTFWGAAMSDLARTFAGDRSAAEVDALLQHTTANFVRLGRRLSWGDVAAARETQNGVTRAAGAHFTRYDLQLTPTVARPAWHVGRLHTDDPDMTPSEWVREATALSPFAALANVTGQPAISIPTAMSGHLPVGVQLSAAQGDDGLLLAVAADLEAAMPWAHRRPRHHVRSLA